MALELAGRLAVAQNTRNVIPEGPEKAEKKLNFTFSKTVWPSRGKNIRDSEMGHSLTYIRIRIHIHVCTDG